MSALRVRVCLALLVIAGFALGCSEFVVIGIQPELAEAFGVSLSQTGNFMSFFAVAYAVATPILALVTGRFKRFTLLIAYSAVLIVGNLLAVMATSFSTMLLARVLMAWFPVLCLLLRSPSFPSSLIRSACPLLFRSFTRRFHSPWCFPLRLASWPQKFCLGMWRWLLFW